MKIAIDGPAGAGKSTISKAVAEKLGYVYIDTGAMYRSVGLAVLKAGLDPAKESDVLSILDDIKIEIGTEEDGQRYYLCGEDVTKSIREPRVSAAASSVAVIPAVRLKLVELQREMAEKVNVIMDGRDIGTYVLPSAEVKVFLTASADERAKRRCAELRAKGLDADFNAVKRDMTARDKNDSEREFAPLKKANDAAEVDTTGLDIPQVIERIMSLVNK